MPTLSDLLSPPGSDDQGTLETMPASYDLRAPGKITAVKDQNPYGTCWSFATLGSLESSLMPGESWDFSEDNMVLNSGFYNGDDPYNWGGNIVMSTAYLVRWGGPVDESADTYGDSYTPAGLSPLMHVQEVNWIPARGSALDNDNLKRAIMRVRRSLRRHGLVRGGGRLHLLRCVDGKLLLLRLLERQPRSPCHRLGRRLSRLQLPREARSATGPFW